MAEENRPTVDGGPDRTLSAVTGPSILIEPPRGWRLLNLRELWLYRELLLQLAWRDIRIRYKQTLIGAAWAVLQPFLTMVVFSIFFGRFAGIPSDGLPYPVFSYAGLLPWTFFAEGMRRAAESLVGNANLVSRVYFPRILIPLGAILAALVDFAFAFVVLIGMMIFYRIPVTWNILYLPAFLALAFLAALGVGLWLSALNVQYRDVRYTLGFIIQIWLFATPVIYPTSLLKGTWKVLVSLNPMTSVVEGSRWALLGSGSPPSGILWASVAAVAFVLVGGLLVFQRMERAFADVI